MLRHSPGPIQIRLGGSFTHYCTIQSLSLWIIFADWPISCHKYSFNCTESTIVLFNKYRNKFLFPFSFPFCYDEAVLFIMRIAQTSPENQTMQATPTLKSTKMLAIDMSSLRDQVRSNHPLLAAIADKIQTMDAQETLKYTIGVDIVADLLRLHAQQLIMNQTAGSQLTP